MYDLYRVIAALMDVAVIVASLGVAAYVTVRRRIVRRTVRRPAAAYWLVLAVSLTCALVNMLHLIYLLTPGGVSGVAAWLDLLAVYPTFIAQSVVIVALVSLKVRGDRNTYQRRVLAIGAHPDDIEIACGGTLALMRDSGYKVRGLVMTHGEQGGNAQVRPGEARNGAEFLGLDSVQVLDLPDTRLEEHSLEVLAAIERAILDFQPDMIFTHSAHDLHQDHRTVHETTLRAARNQSMVLCYESPSVTHEFVPTFFVDIGDYVAVKMEGIREHADQREKPYMKAERVKGTAVFRGAQARTRYAEGFEVVRVLFSTMVGGHALQPEHHAAPSVRPEPALPALPRLSQESTL